MAASRRKSPAIVRDLFSCAGSLSDLGNRAGELSRLDRLLSGLLPEPLARHVRACAVRNGTLVLQTDSPVWSTRLRMTQRQLLAAMRTEAAPDISRLQILVSPPVFQVERSKPARRLSAAAANLLAHCARSETDPALRAALTRLSSRT
jgi:hypothetical protein